MKSTKYLYLLVCLILTGWTQRVIAASAELSMKEMTVRIQLGTDVEYRKMVFALHGMSLMRLLEAVTKKVGAIPIETLCKKTTHSLEEEKKIKAVYSAVEKLIEANLLESLSLANRMVFGTEIKELRTQFIDIIKEFQKSLKSNKIEANLLIKFQDLLEHVSTYQESILELLALKQDFLKDRAIYNTLRAFSDLQLSLNMGESIANCHKLATQLIDEGDQRRNAERLAKAKDLDEEAEKNAAELLAQLHKAEAKDEEVHPSTPRRGDALRTFLTITAQNKAARKPDLVSSYLENDKTADLFLKNAYNPAYWSPLKLRIVLHPRIPLQKQHQDEDFYHNVPISILDNAAHFSPVNKIHGMLFDGSSATPLIGQYGELQSKRDEDEVIFHHGFKIAKDQGFDITSYPFAQIMKDWTALFQILSSEQTSQTLKSELEIRNQTILTSIDPLSTEKIETHEKAKLVVPVVKKTDNFFLLEIDGSMKVYGYFWLD